MEIMKGKFIVIDGSDGSGKATQTKILIDTLKKQKYRIKTIEFPQYGKKSAAMVEQYLTGKYGTANDVGPYVASVFYAVDRYAASFKIRDWLKKGNIVVSNRYVSSNKGHQLTKITGGKNQEKYLKWLDEFEYKTLGVPKEDLVIILYVPAKIAQKLVDKKGHRDYIGGSKRDIHEADLSHLKKAEAVYKKLTKKYTNWKLVDCTNKGKLLSKQEIQKKVWKIVKKFLS